MRNGADCDGCRTFQPRQRDQPERPADVLSCRVLSPAGVQCRPPEPAQSRHSRLPLIRPSRSLLRAPPGTRPRRATRGRVSRPGRTGRTLCRAVAVTTVRQARTRIRRRATALVGLIQPCSSWSRATVSTDAVATALVSDTATAAGTTPAIAGVTPSSGSLGRCLPHCLLVVLQHLGHGCLHGSACLLALLAQLTAQGQGGCPR